MVRFFTDLDNTLIYSHRHKITDAFKLIEVLDGKEQGYMTQYTFSFLKGAKWMQIVPVTTRTQLQYSRLSIFPTELRCRYALVGNGAILLEDGVSDKNWYDDSLDICKHAIPAVKRVNEVLGNCMDDKHIHGESPFFIYASCDNVEQIRKTVVKEVKTDQINIHINGKKIFFIPKSLTKGTAIQRFNKKYGAMKTLTAGDSDFDYSMLEEGDYAFVPNNISQAIFNRNIILLEHIPIISDEICDKINILHKKGLLDDQAD